MCTDSQSAPASTVKQYGGQHKKKRRKQVWTIVFEFNTRD